MKIFGDNQNPMSEINVTPFVDVMLVLLVIFMITAPKLEQGVNVALPEVQAPELPVKAEELVLSITDKKEIYINKYPVEFQELAIKMRTILSQRESKEVYLRADKNVDYGFVVKVMAELRKAGAVNLGLVTEPEQIKR